MHVHQSLTRDGGNAFFDADDQVYLSPTAKAFIAGQLKHAREIAPLFAQFVNSYKRLVPGFEAPTYLAWSRRNRSALIRVPLYHPGKEQATRAELRCPDTACNAHLYFKGMLHAGLEGVEKGYELPEPMEQNLYHLTPEEREARHRGASGDARGGDRDRRGLGARAAVPRRAHLQALHRDQAPGVGRLPGPGDPWGVETFLPVLGTSALMGVRGSPHDEGGSGGVGGRGRGIAALCGRSALAARDKPTIEATDASSAGPTAARSSRAAGTASARSAGAWWQVTRGSGPHGGQWPALPLRGHRRTDDGDTPKRWYGAAAKGTGGETRRFGCSRSAHLTRTRRSRRRGSRPPTGCPPGEFANCGQGERAVGGGVVPARPAGFRPHSGERAARRLRVDRQHPRRRHTQAVARDRVQRRRRRQGLQGVRGLRPALGRHDRGDPVHGWRGPDRRRAREVRAWRARLGRGQRGPPSRLAGLFTFEASGPLDASGARREHQGRRRREAVVRGRVQRASPTTTGTSRSSRSAVPARELAAGDAVRGSCAAG